MDIRWRKSSFSEDSDGNCLELARCGGEVLLRESDEPLVIIKAAPQAVRALLLGARAGEFDRLDRSAG
ncbi:DUF397 domain-containing protein [Streptomyces sp. F63]|uniref:DUF397 domain-containing protein n=1 Tax=Streptomyces sp. F63 TaxID=2824887 RepID=UPI001B388015|nr:DUF397 domain-containing protein [Streptomyces sp. F63]MBQ0983014.1 DUF397 domain-containing protein [Streptomyces sp. F63]